ncbi:dihydrofolate reductase family protein [Oerskovia sp. M15]
MDHRARCARARPPGASAGRRDRRGNGDGRGRRPVPDRPHSRPHPPGWRAPPALADHQPLRVVVGRRDLPAHLRLAPAGAWTTDGGGAVLHLRTHDVRAVLAELASREVRHVLVEGGPGLATAFLAAGVVDEVHAYLAPCCWAPARAPWATWA